MNEERERRFADLKEATGEKTTSKALDQAAMYFIRMRGSTTAVPIGNLRELMQLVDEQGSVTAEEIADVLDTPELPVEFQSNWSVGDE